MITPEERAELDSIQAELKALYRTVKARPLEEIEQRIADDMRELAPLLPNQSAEVSGLIANLGLLSMTADEKRTEAKLVARHNVLATRIKARGQAQRDARAAAKDRAKVRSEMCPKCFTIHPSGDCY